LTSGLRSAIIKADSGKYLKLKGVATKKHPRRGKDHGKMCSMFTFIEYATLLTLDSKDEFFIPLKANFIELRPREDSPAEVLSVIRHKESALYNEKHPKDLNRLVDFIKAYEDHHFVLGAEISGDTRLDEMIYALTRKVYTGDEQILRDDLLKYCCFRAGQAKAFLTMDGVAMSDNFTNTNNHIGNYVLFNRRGYTTVGIVDFTGCVFNLRFKKKAFALKQPKKTFYEHTNLETAETRDDFFEKYTFSTPVPLKYRYFNEELRESCWKSFETGYKIMLTMSKSSFPSSQPPYVALPIDALESFTIPKEIGIPDIQFRKSIDQLL